MYTVINFKSKKELKEAVLAGKEVRIFAPGLGTPIENGKEYISGPHYPKPHTFYAEVIMVNGLVKKVK